ncbi:hypothetical protein NPIL_310701 [Nephila pilipes]|uniref:Uncharacterized protein n=1 Tax=Nephila pilipes TaxID=299642 RepID=A0A8X6PZX8_NEPPI|nr:hypothetical protein NPIL_310701 [Nephila pilipes]
MDHLHAALHDLFPDTEESAIISDTLLESENPQLYVKSVEHDKIDHVINNIDNLFNNYYASTELPPTTLENLRIIRQDLVAGDI